MNEMLERVARIVMQARGCTDDDAAVANTGFPCPFCLWSEDAQEESGCVMWAEKIIAAMREPTSEIPLCFQYDSRAYLKECNRMKDDRQMPQFSLGGGPRFPLGGGPSPSWPDFLTMLRNAPQALWLALKGLWIDLRM